jgi:hypothetical protein
MRKNIVNISLIVIAVAFLTLLALRVRAGGTDGAGRPGCCGGCGPGNSKLKLK